MSEAGQQQRLRLLCFDGGGVRGLSSLYIIQQLMEAVDRQHPPKPCQFFDMIGGTSTGGLIAIMLGRLEMSVADCIAAYSRMMDGVFKKKQHRVDIRGQVQARFDTAQLEGCIKSIVRQFACATPMLVATDIVKFSSYQREYEPISNLFDEVKIWEVCRAAAAACTFFDPIKVGRHKLEFLDGATRANNPINELLKYNHRELSEDEKLYRFNVMRGLEDVGLEDASSQDVIAQMTMSYMGTQDMKETLKKFKRVTEHQDQNSNALLVYEGVYKAMCDPSTDNRFHNYFANLNPVPQGLKGDLVKQVWLRLPLEEQASANKDLILAAVYMIHMEGLVNPTYRPKFSPPDSNQFSYYRAKFMWRYGNWTRTILDWADGFEDGGTRVTKREFPVMYFDDDQTIPWVGLGERKCRDTGWRLWERGSRRT
ncbi:hypothetical protein DL765_003354 [Monosporascus sp. GIB2]|nr:hypothetical protein DL765_003354 [Monosporascus sp. GIB2]